MATAKMEKQRRTEMIAIRITPDELEELKKRAAEAGLSRTDYLLGSALGGLEAAPHKQEQRFKRLEERLARIEASLFG